MSISNYYVLLRLNWDDSEDEIDSKARNSVHLLDAQSSFCSPTYIRRALHDPATRVSMREALVKNGLFEADYRKEERVIRFSSLLPEEYGEFVVFTGRERLVPGPYDDDFLHSHCTRIGEAEDERTVSLRPERPQKYYYPAICSGDGAFYLIGCEENRAFIRDLKVRYSYESVSATFAWGKFSKSFYIVAPGGAGKYPPREDDILKSVAAGMGADYGKAAGQFTERNRSNRVRFLEESGLCGFYELPEDGV